MNIEWNKQSFQALKECWESAESKAGLSDWEIPPQSAERALKTRYEGIECMVESDLIWPLTSSPARQRFNTAFREVLSRLPQEDFDQVDFEIGFILEDPAVKYFSVNVPAQRDVKGGKVGIDTIVLFHTCLNFPPEAMIGLIAHEIAHSFVSGPDNAKDEALADDKTREWGFGDELKCLELAKKAALG